MLAMARPRVFGWHATHERAWLRHDEAFPGAREGRPVAYAGLNNLRLRFRLTSDVGTEDDGWLVDDIQVLVYPQDVTDVAPGSAPGPEIALAPAGANPFHDTARLVATFRSPTAFRAAVYAVDGTLVRVLGHGMAAAGGPRDRLGRGAILAPAVASGTYLGCRIDSRSRLGDAAHRSRPLKRQAPKCGGRIPSPLRHRTRAARRRRSVGASS